MEELGTLFIILSSLLAVTLSQRVAPGVPPQQYQQQPPPPPNQQYQQIPQQQQQHYQVPVQQPQVPIQQQQQQPYQQVPIQHQAPMHGVPQAHNPHGQQQQILHSSNIAHEKQHIQEHLDVPIDTSKMSEQELQFHYFKMHDADNNNKLDGCELIKSLIHWHEQGHNDQHGQVPSQEKLFKDEELTQLIDPILLQDDTNADGYIDYPEFIQAQQKASAAQAAQARP